MIRKDGHSSKVSIVLSKVSGKKKRLLSGASMRDLKRIVQPCPQLEVSKFRRNIAARLDKLHPQVDLSCKYLNRRMAMSAVQICALTALGFVPTSLRARFLCPARGCA